jgi:hypothetical protein
MDMDLFVFAGFTGKRFSNPKIVTHNTCKDSGNLAMSDSMRQELDNNGEDSGNLAMSDSMRQELDNNGEGFADVHR